MTLLLTLIFAVFIGVGIPDSVLGAAWPSIYREFGLPISMQGYIGIAVSVGTVFSGLSASYLIRRLGTGRLTAISTLLTALALLGFSFAPHPAFFFLFAIPLGLGAGAIDTGLNSFVALHYSASRMSFLHCFYGIGVAASPFVLSLALGDAGNWRAGYFAVAMIQFAITLISFLALPLWRRAVERDEREGVLEKKTLGILEVLRVPGVVWFCLAFFTSCALELSAGSWSSSFFVNTKGLAADRAALVTVLFYAGLALGRFLSGVVAGRLGRRRILRISLAVLPFALLCFLLPLPLPVTALGLFLIGAGVGPIFPNLMHLTPKLFGEEITESVMGVQQATTYIGVMLMPWLFGILAETFSTALLPYYLVLMFLFYSVTLLFLRRGVRKR